MTTMADRYTISKPVKILGLMTGSSADGLDICLVQFSGRPDQPDYEVTYSTHIQYPEIFYSAFTNPLELDQTDIRRLDKDLGKWFAVEIEKIDLDFDMIASHGQTIKHQPPDFTLQIGDPRFMYEKFDKPVVYDFRTADIEAGGQGAPLIPIVDQYLFQKEDDDILALNIGGISNLTIVPARSNKHPLLAWDTGPGNTLIDKAARLFSKGKLSFDPEGSIAAQGNINNKLLGFLLQHEFYQLSPPRSAGQEQFGLGYFNSILKQYHPRDDQEFKDLAFTLTVLTAKSIASSVLMLPKLYTPKDLIISGGGFKNLTLISLIKSELSSLSFNEANINGVNSDNKEAFGFAYLGYRTLIKLPGNIPSVTGADKAVVLGKLYPPNLKFSHPL